MSTRGFARRPRLPGPGMPGGEVELEAPPEVPRPVPGGLLMKLMPVVMVIAMLGMVALMFTSGGAKNPMMMLFPLMMVFSMVGMIGNSGAGKTKKPAELNEERKDYFRYLAGVREDVQKTVAEQRAALRWNHPDPRALSDLIGGRRMWERSAADADFAHVRIGVGNQRLATKLAVPALGPLEDLEPISTVSMRRFVHTHSVVQNLPTALSLRGFAAITVGGDRVQARSVVRSIILQLCVFHGPAVVRVAIVTPEPDGADWAWTKWLPHNAHPTESDALGPARLSFRSLHDLEESLDEELLGRGRFSRMAEPVPGRAQLIVVLDGGQVTGDERILAGAGMDGISILDLTGDFEALAARRGMRLQVRDGQIGGHSASGLENFGLVDEMPVAEAVALARMLAGYRLAAARASADTEGDGRDQGLMGLLGLGDPLSLTPATAWRPRSARERLRVPIGVDASGAVVEIDLKEAAENGMGPHGLCIGATGSGKSELLRTLVLSLIASHSPDQLNLVLVDFKGGATFLGLEAADHVAAVITNLEEELEMVDRMHDALSGEMNRRQELLRSAGNYANVNDYERARANGAPLAPLPALFIVVDEFSELLSQKPEFAELFTAIGRLGRSLHIHLLLASQRLDEGRLRGLDSHLSYRIGLKTFSGNESRSVLGVPDAYHLPNVPGSGFLKCDSGELIRFNSSYVSGPVGRRPRALASIAAAEVRILEFTAEAQHLPEPSPAACVDVGQGDASSGEPGCGDGAAAEPEREESLLDVVVGRLAGSGRRAHEVWLPPLDRSPSVDQLAATQPAAAQPGLQALIGVVDRPYEQRRDVLCLDLAGAGGNIAVVGGPQSGKSTAARTIVMALASAYSPRDVQFYCLDFGGGTLSGLAGLPHVGVVAGRSEADRVRRTVAELAGLVTEREAAFRAERIESMRQFRDRRAALPPAEERLARFGDVFLVVDGWGAIREDFEQLEPTITALAARGLSYGVHVVLCANRWGEFRPALKDMLGTRVELRQGDPADSEMDRRKAAHVPVGRPGRGLTRDGKHLLLALPRLDGVRDAVDLGAGVADAVARLCARWPGVGAPEVRMLPLDVPREQVLAADSGGGGRHRVPIGIDESALAPVYLDFDVQPHFYAFAAPESGKTTLLRDIVLGLVERNTAEQAKLILVDYRRTMLGVVEGPHLAGYAPTGKGLEPMVAQLVQILSERMPGPDVTQQQLRERSWWSGPEVYVVVDDYDLVSASSPNPLLPLVEFLSQAKDVGLHMILARRSGGASRAMFDPVIGRLRELSADGIVMSGSREEGPLIGGARPSAMPPGRGILVTRAGGERLVQVANLPDL